MRQLTALEIKQLEEKEYLDSDGHPSVKAYKSVFTSPSSDFSSLAIAVEEHGRDCPICGDRYKKAIEELFNKK